ncbi:ribonuclease E/G [uncultured Croceicoccus sp.]|uniref:ribonuclease E/G n=1 Tax=uncultured Croceicoccus sp. TaxID=1295329 RepID=UPI002625FA2E|nr:ribonuclease E/G [uncultured Croceicoccus sp.]
MADWRVEDGIAEERAACIENDAIVAARIRWPGELAAGAVVAARLVARHTGAARGTARLADGTEVLVSRLPRDASEGAEITLDITRAAIGEPGRVKRAQARPTDAALRSAPTLFDMLREEGHDPVRVRSFPGGEWDALMAEAFERRLDFTGGAIVLSPTPAMTLIDIDGTLPPRALSLAAVPAIAAALRRFDMGGSVGIDFPTLPDKADRRAVDDALAHALAGFAHERTAMNGFGFVQIVSRNGGPSILHRVAHRRMAAAARHLLRRAERVAGAGPILITAHPALAPHLSEERIAELSRRTGRATRITTDPALAPEAGFAQAVEA